MRCWRHPLTLPRASCQNAWDWQSNMQAMISITHLRGSIPTLEAWRIRWQITKDCYRKGSVSHVWCRYYSIIITSAIARTNSIYSSPSFPSSNQVKRIIKISGFKVPYSQPQQHTSIWKVNTSQVLHEGSRPLYLKGKDLICAKLHNFLKVQKIENLEMICKSMNESCIY